MELMQCSAGEHCLSLTSSSKICLAIHPGENVEEKRKVLEEHIAKATRPSRLKRPTKKKLALDKENEERMLKNIRKCGICDRSVRTNQQDISCKRCETNFHLTCSGLEQAISDYYCMGCMGNELEISRTLEKSIRMSDSDTDTSSENIASPESEETESKKKNAEMITAADKQPKTYDVPKDTMIDEESNKENLEKNKKEEDPEYKEAAVNSGENTENSTLTPLNIAEEPSIIVEETPETSEEFLATSAEPPNTNKEPLEINEELRKIIKEPEAKQNDSLSQSLTPSPKQQSRDKNLSVHTIDSTMCTNEDTSDDSSDDPSNDSGDDLCDDPDWNAKSEGDDESEVTESTSR